MDHDFAPTPNGTIGQNSNKIGEEERPTISVVIDEDDEGEEEDDIVEQGSNPKGSATEHYIHSPDKMSLIQISALNLDHNYVSGTPSREATAASPQGKKNFPVLHGLNIDDVEEQANTFPTLPKTYPVQRRPIKLSGYGHGPAAGDFYKQHLKGVLLGQPNRSVVSNLQQQHKQPQQQQRFSPRLLSSSAAASSVGSGWHGHQQHAVSAAAPIVAPRIAPRGRPPGSGSRARQQSSATRPIYNSGVAPMVQQQQQHFEEQQHLMTRRGEQQQQQQHRQQQQHNTFADVMEEEEIENEKFFLQQQQQMGGGPPLQSQQQRGRRPKKQRDEEMFDTTSMSYQQHHQQQQQESSKPPDDPVPCQQSVANHHQQLQQQHNHHHHLQQPYESSIDSAIDSVVRGDALVMQNFAPSSSSSSSACFGAATASSSSTLAQLFHSHTASAPTITTSTSTSLTRQQQQQQHSFVEHHSPPRHHQHAPSAAVAGGGMMTHHYPQYLHRHPMIPTVAKQSLSPPSQSLEDLADLAQASSSLLQQTTNSMLRTQPAAAAAVAAAAASAYQQQPSLVQPVHKQQPTLHFKVVATNNQPENYPPKEYRQQVFTVQQQQQLDEEASKTTVVKKLTKKQMETIQCEFGELRPDGTAKENAGATTEPKQQQQKRVRKSMETTAEAIKSADDGEDETRATDRPLRRSAGVGRPKRSAEIGQQMIKKKKRNWEGVDDYVTRCICGTRHTDPFMIECDQCDVWQHGVCMGVTKKTVPEQYFCEQCKPRELLLTASQAAAKQKAFLASLPPPPVGRRGRRKKLKLKQEQLQHKRMLGRRPAEPLSSTTQLGSVLRGNVQKRRGRPPKRRFPGAAVAGAVMAKISNTKSPSVTTSPTTAALGGRTFDREAATAEMALRDNMLDDTSSVAAHADKTVEGEQQQQQLKELVVQTTPIENCYSRAVKVLMAQLPSGSRTHLALLQRLKNNAPLARQMYVAPNVEGLVATPGDLAKVETGTPLIEYNGMISLLSEVQSRTPSKLNQHNFTLIYKGLGESKELFVDACRVVSDARAVRKSCRPNAAVKHAILDGQIHIYLVATTDIDKSTEITIPFDSDYWDSCVPVECACGFSKNQSSSPGGMRCPVQEFNEALSSGDLASFEAKKMKRLTRSFGNTTGGGTTRAEDGAAIGGSSGQPQQQQQQQHTDHVDNNTNRQLDKKIQPNDGGDGDMKTVVKMETPKAKKSEDGGGAAGLRIIKMETLKKRKSDGGSGGTKIKMETLKKRKSDGGSGGMKTTFKLETSKKNKPHDEIPFHQLCAELGRILHKKLVDSAIVAEEFKLPAEFDALRIKCDKERAKKVQTEVKEEQQQQQQKSLKRKATSKDADDDKEANLFPSVQTKKEKEDEKQQKLQQHGVEVEEEEEQKGTEADGIGLDQQQKDSSESFVVQQTGAEMVPAVELIASSSSSTSAVATTSTPESSARLPNTKALKKITIDEYKRKRMAEMAEKPSLTKSSSTSAVKDRSSQQQQSPPVAVRQSPRKSFFPIVVNVPSPPQQIEDFPSLSPPSGIGGRQQQQAVSAATSLSGGRMTKTTTSSTIDELKKRILGSRTGGLPAPSGLPPLTPSSSYLSAGAAGLSVTSTVVAGASVATEPQHPPLPDLAAAPPHKAQLQPRVSLEERLRARFGSGGRKK